MTEMRRLQWCVIAIISILIGAWLLRSKTDYKRSHARRHLQPAQKISHVSSNSRLPGDDEGDISDWWSPNFGSVEPVAISPYSLAQAINRNTYRWSRRGPWEVLDLRPVWTELRIESGNFPQCEGGVRAKTFRIHLDEYSGEGVLLKLTIPFFVCRYLLFKKLKRPDHGDTWLFLGKIDWDENRYGDSWHQIGTADHRHWLVIRGQTGFGTGFQAYDDTWYEIRKGGLRQVLNYTAKAAIFYPPSGLGWTLTSRVVRPSEGRSAEVRFRSSYFWFSDLDYQPFFSKTTRIRFKWGSRDRHFTFSRLGSQVSQAEFEANFQGESWSEENALKYNLRDLMRIATVPYHRKRAWLRELVTGCKDTPERKALLRALKGGGLNKKRTVGVRPVLAQKKISQDPLPVVAAAAAVGSSVAHS